LTKTLSRNAQAIRQKTPTPIAAAVAISLYRDGHSADCRGDHQRQG
jgi:hypothetical protein